MRNAQGIVRTLGMAIALALAACTSQGEPELARVVGQVPQGAGALTRGDDGWLYFSEFDRRGDEFEVHIGAIGGAIWRFDPSGSEAAQLWERNAMTLVVREAAWKP